MSKKNVSYVIPAAEFTAIFDMMDQINGKMPFLINLTEDEKADLYKMGPKSVDFVQDSAEAAKAFPHVLPPSFDKQEHLNDADLIRQMIAIKVRLDSMKEKVDDTLMQVGSEAMDSAREIYHLFKLQSGREPGLKSVVDKLEPRFSRRRKKQAVDTETNV